MAGCATDFARRLGDFPEVFEVSGNAVALSGRYGDFESRSAVLQEVVGALHDKGEVPNWRGEDYGVSCRWGAAPLFKLERAAVPLFGLPAYGVHVNGYVSTPEGLQLWVGRRSKHKALGAGQTGPPGRRGTALWPRPQGERDQGGGGGGQRAGGPGRRALVPSGPCAISAPATEGQRNDVLFCYDLELPADFVPRPGDDEVEEFFLWPMAEVLNRLRAKRGFQVQRRPGEPGLRPAPRRPRPRRRSRTIRPSPRPLQRLSRQTRPAAAAALWASARIMSLAFSPIMIAGALVLPETIVRHDRCSRRPEARRCRARAGSHRPPPAGIRAHLAGPGGVVDGCRGVAHPLQQIFVTFDRLGGLMAAGDLAGYSGACLAIRWAILTPARRSCAGRSRLPDSWDGSPDKTWPGCPSGGARRGSRAAADRPTW